MPDILLTLIALGLISAATYWAGYWIGGRSLRKRFTMLSEAIEESNRIYKNWSNSQEGTDWMKGFKAGVSTTLNTLQAFIDKAIPDDDPS